jgi:hypothetical protein
MLTKHKRIKAKQFLLRPLKCRAVADNSQQVSQLRALQDMANNSPQSKQAAQLQVMAIINTGLSAKSKVGAD